MSRARKHAEFGFGGDAYPGSTPQYENDHAPEEQPFLHDEPDYEPGSGDYAFVFGNGQLHVSPNHSHDELMGHAQIDPESRGPIATGNVTVDRGRATFHCGGNVSLRGLSKTLQEYCKQVGWQWGGLTDLDGQPIHDDFAPKKSMHLRDNDSGAIVTWFLQGKTAHVAGLSDDQVDAIREAGYKIADVPGGSNMNDQMTNYWPGGETLDQHNLGDNKADLPETEPDEQPTGTFRCPECGQIFNQWGEYLVHRNGEGMQDEPVDDSKMTPLPDMDKTLPPRFRDRRPFVMPLASYKEAERYDDYLESAALYDLRGRGTTLYGAYRSGEIRGVAAVRDGTIIWLEGRTASVRDTLVQAIQVHYAELKASDTALDPRSGARLGFVKTASGYRWAAGNDPKNMIDRPVPFIYDIQGDKLVTGLPGQRTTDILVPGKFTPGGIVEGEYMPGGEIHLHSRTNMPYSVRHLLDLWYWSPTTKALEITDVIDHTSEGQERKLAKVSGQSVGQYIKTLAATDPAVWNAYQALRKAGGTVYVVGGAVRDALLQKEPKDVDLMVTGLPSEQVNTILDKLPGRVDLTGKSFGVYRYNTKGYEVEIALPRTEKSTGDRRVHFDVDVDHTLPIEDDLLRRDFTVNSMAVDLDSGRLVDPYGGAQDIEERKLHTTHPSSFQEDPTRLLRGLVMHARYGLRPDERTRQEIKANAPRLALESNDALRPIYDKLFTAKDPASAIRLAHDTGLLHHMFPEVEQNWDYDQNNPHHNYPLGEHLLNVLENVASHSHDPDLRVAALLHDIGKPASRWDDPETGISHYYRSPEGQGDDHESVGARMAENRLRSLRFPVARINRISHLIQHHMFPAFSSAKGARKFLHRVGDEHADDLLTLRWADQHGKGQTPAELAARTSVDTQRGLVEQVRSAQEPTSQSALAINGNDIIALGIKAGPAVGRILRQLTDDVVEDPSLNTPEALKERAQEYVAALPT